MTSLEMADILRLADEEISRGGQFAQEGIRLVFDR
jgi:hypothetical protein